MRSGIHDRIFFALLCLIGAMAVSSAVGVTPQWSADFSSMDAFAKGFTVSGYSYPPQTTLTAPLPAKFLDGQRHLTSDAGTFWEELRPTKPIYDKLVVGHTYTFSATVTQHPMLSCMTRLNVVFGEKSTISGSPMLRFNPAQRVDNAVCFGQTGDQIRGSTDWDNPNALAKADSAAHTWQIVVTPLAATATAVTKVNFLYKYDDKEVLNSTFSCQLTFPVSLAFVTYTEKPMNGQSVILANLNSVDQAREKPAGKSLAATDKSVWCHYVAWHDWNQTPTATTNYYDFPWAYPTGDTQRDYRQEIDIARKIGINGFLVDIVNGDAFTAQALAMMQAARGTDFMISGCLDGFSDPPEKLADKVAAFLTNAEKEPNLARIDGKPLFSTYAGDRGDAEYWRKFREALTAQGCEIFLVVDAVDKEKYQQSFDMLYNFGALDNYPFAADILYPKMRDAVPSTLAHQWMAGISPGYVGAWPFSGRNHFYNAFRGIDQFWTNWETAVKLQSPWIHLTTWNDLDETPLQPMIFEFNTYPELTRYWIERWKGQDQPSPAPRLYLAYQREQILGTVQRIELVSLPTTAGAMSASLELRSMDGKTITTLPAQTLPGEKAARVDWAVPTTAFANSPIVEPVIHVQAGKVSYLRRLPFFTMRTGWIANKTNVRVPVHEMSDGRATLAVAKDAQGNLRANVTLHSPDTIRSATLWRNDRPLGTFAATPTQGVTHALRFVYVRPVHLQVAVTGGKILNAYHTLESATNPNLTWTETSLSVNYPPYTSLAAELLDSGNAALAVTVDGGAPQTVTLADLRNGTVDLRGQDGQAACRLTLPDMNSLTVCAPALAIKDGSLSGRWYTRDCFVNDLFYVRCETTDGRCFYSNVVAPFSAGQPKIATSIQQTAVYLDGGAIGGGGSTAFFTKPPFSIPKITAVSVHPAMVQRNAWNFDEGDGSQNALGRDPLYLGCSGLGYYTPDVNRTPKRVTRGDAPGYCLVFDGIDDIAEFPLRQFPTGAFTVSLDICPDGEAGKEQTIIGPSGWQSCPALRILADGRLQGGREQARQENGTPDVILATSKDPLPKGVWSHVEMSFDEQTVKLFVNGKLVGTASGTAARTYGNLCIHLGNDSAGHAFQGKLDSVHISSVATP